MEQERWDLLWTPHRIAYIKGESRPRDTAEGPQCPFCRTDDSEETLIVARGDHTYVVMNLFPYNPGHVLICPYRHVADFTELTAEETAELSWFQARMMTAIRAASNPAGFNIGLNQGPAAGAGISGHLHQHIVPRWPGDSNFMTTVGGSRTMVMLLEESAELFRDALATAPAPAPAPARPPSSANPPHPR